MKPLKRYKTRTTVVISLISFFSSSKAHAWGHLGHQTIATIASQITRNKDTFWATNASNMGTLTNIPDQYWKTGPNAQNEKPTHWFQIDSYFSDQQLFSTFPRDYNLAEKKYSAPTLIKNGTATWRINQFYNLALAAFKRGDFQKGLEMAGAMSHYVGDLSQPLHVSKNYDGQETGDVGIHHFFETANLESSNHDSLSRDVTNMALNLLSNQNFLSKFNGSVTDIAFEEINRSFVEAERITTTDIKIGRNQEGSAALLNIAKERMADGAASLSLLLERLSKEAGLNNQNGASISINIPNWISPQYINTSAKSKSFYTPSASEKIAQDLSNVDCEM